MCAQNIESLRDFSHPNAPDRHLAQHFSRLEIVIFYFIFNNWHLKVLNLWILVVELWQTLITMNSSINWFLKTTSTAVIAVHNNSKTAEFIKYIFLKFFFIQINELWTFYKLYFTSYLKLWSWFKSWNKLTLWFLMFWPMFNVWEQLIFLQ